MYKLDNFIKQNLKYCSDINIGPGYRICEERAPVELIRRIKSEVKAFQVGILKARSPWVSASLEGQGRMTWTESC